jgi:hypothetical protein
MARARFFENARRVNIVIERGLHEAAKARAQRYGLRGGFSEYVARLIAVDAETKRGRLISPRRRTG